MGRTYGPGVTSTPIAQSSQLYGSVDTHNGQTFFTVKGPCGEGHTMNATEAKRLLLWLEQNIDAIDPNWRLTLDLKLDDPLEPTTRPTA